MTRAAALLILAVTAVSVTSTLGCVPPAAALRIAPGSRQDSLVFLLTDLQGQPRSGSGIYGMSVIPCGSRDASWTIAADGSRLFPGRILYGDTIPGFPTSTGPRPLAPGCYDAIVSSGEPLRFRIDRNGVVQAAP